MLDILDSSNTPPECLPNPVCTHQEARVEFDTGLLSISFVRSKNQLIDLRVVCRSNGHRVLGEIDFGSPRLKEGREIVEVILGIGREEPALEGEPEFFADVLRLQEALLLAERRKISYKSALGVDAIDITAEYGDLLFDALSPSALRRLMQIEKLATGIYHVSISSPELLARIFVRFQEHFESPQFAGKTFSLEEFKSWYRAEKGKGSFTYYQDWGGFNIPGTTFDAFREGKFEPLRPVEQTLLRTFSHLTTPFYLIGTTGEVETLRHEIAHALFHTNPSYRAEVLEVLEEIDSGPIVDYLSHGYHERSFVDEVHAHLIDDLRFLREQGVDTGRYRKAHGLLEGIFERYWDKSRFSSPKTIKP